MERWEALFRWPLDGGSTFLISIFVSRVFCILFWEGLDDAANILISEMNIEILLYEFIHCLFVCLFFCFCQGGIGTDQEMCLSFLYYYPKLNLTRCLSSYRPAKKKFQKEHMEWVCDISFRGLLSIAKIVCRNSIHFLCWGSWKVLVMRG